MAYFEEMSSLSLDNKLILLQAQIITVSSLFRHLHVDWDVWIM